LTDKRVKKIRDSVWKEIWKQKKVKDDFKKRLRRYSPILVINACTETLYKEVEIEEIKNEVPEAKWIRLSHPSSWFGKNPDRPESAYKNICENIEEFCKRAELHSRDN